MRKFFVSVVYHKKTVITAFLAIFLVCLVLKNQVAVDYDINDYLPEDVHSTVSLDKMTEEFDGGIPNARVMISDITIPEALEYKEKLKAVDGVTSVMWLDDTVDLTVPLSTMDQETLETYYKDKEALFTVTIEEHSRVQAVAAIRNIIGDENAMAGSAVSTAAATTNTVAEIQKIAVIAVLFVLVVLILTTNSWVEPLVILAGLGVAIVINAGTNLIFGEISFVSNAAGSILQLAVSLDYSVFLMHRFDECRQDAYSVRYAMVEALCKSVSSILSSGLTTVIGFLALVLMQFQLGPDLGLVLAKGVAISLITVFVLMPVLILLTCQWMDKTRHRSLMPGFHKFGRVVRRISLPMVCVFALVIAPAYLASNSNDYYYGSSHIFGEGTQIGRDTEKIEQIFGKNDTYVLMVPAGDTATETALSNELHTLPEVTDIVSFVDVAGAEIPMEYVDEDTLSQIVSDNYSRMVISTAVPYEGEQTFSLVQRVRDIAQEYYPDAYYLAGEGVSTYDLKCTVTDDMLKVNLLAIGAVFLVLLLTMHSISLPVILVLSIETAIWLNLSVPYFTDTPIFYIAYLIISSIQLGATVDYAILMTDRYRENRQRLDKKNAVVQTISDVTVSILTSGSVLTVVGFLLGYISTNQLLAQLGIFIGRGAIFSLVIVLFVLPGLLYLFDRVVIRQKSRLEEQLAQLAHHTHKEANENES
ncbi:MAG: RND family transporter [Butyricicoccaceae bacterium]